MNRCFQGMHPVEGEWGSSVVIVNSLYKVERWERARFMAGPASGSHSLSRREGCRWPEWRQPGRRVERPAGVEAMPRRVWPLSYSRQGAMEDFHSWV